MAARETSLLYYEKGDVFECGSTVESVEEAAGYKVANCYSVVLDRTVCYPQGGGQPSDTGAVYKDGASTFNILEARMNRDTRCVEHIGLFSGPAFSVGDRVTVKIDEEKRRLHSRIHSAGHLIDTILYALGYRLKTSRGYHFPDSPYVEYKGDLSDAEIAALKEKVGEKAKELIDDGIAVDVRLGVTREEAVALCGDLDEMYLKTPSLRLITIGGFSIPCGGTHVNSLSELKAVEIQKIKATRGKQLVRFCYKVAS